MLSFKDFIDTDDYYDKIIESLTDEEIDHFLDIIDPEDIEQEDKISLAVNEVRYQKLRTAERRVSHRDYLIKKRAILRKQKIYRRKQKYKDYLRKRDRMQKMGRTSTGKYIRTKKYV